MKHALLAVAAGVLVSTSAGSQPYGVGPGTMPPWMMGPGMMGGYGMASCGYGPFGYGANLTSEQRAKIAEVQQEIGRKQWDLMLRMHEQGAKMADAYRGGKLDEKAALQAYDAMAALRRQMFQNSLEARKRIDALVNASG